jgi:hypothetical protein
MYIDKDTYIRNKFKAFKYSLGIFVIIMFLWWFAGGHIIPIFEPNPSPAEAIGAATANIFKNGLANIYSFFLELFGF